MIEIIAYEMQYIGGKVESDLILSPFSAEYYPVYEKIYNDCFYDMRKALNVKPYHFYSSIEQLSGKKDNIFLWIENEKLIGSVACYGNEIDDLIVSKQYQGQGYGKHLLLWAIHYLQNMNDLPIMLHVAKWNIKALNMYEKNNFRCIRQEKIR